MSDLWEQLRSCRILREWDIFSLAFTHLAGTGAAHNSTSGHFCFLLALTGFAEIKSFKPFNKDIVLNHIFGKMYCSDTVVKTDCLCQQLAAHVSALEFSAEFPYISWGWIGMLRPSLTMSIVSLVCCQTMLASKNGLFRVFVQSAYICNADSALAGNLKKLHKRWLHMQ